MASLKHPDLNGIDFHGLVACSPQMRRLIDQIGRAARSEVTVLLRGETGTGKELAATALHDAGNRSSKPFRAVNCATFTSEMLASELFGHVKGAFTGAVRDRQGLMAQADGGTLFLDEVAEIPVELQGRLLRVIEEQRFVPVGGTREIRVDVRIVSATNASLRELVSSGRFREDLMYRLRVVVLRLPPLRERLGDLELLTWTFIDRLNNPTRRIRAIELSAWQAMATYPWPGNVRELHNMLEAAYVLGDGATLLLDDLAPELRGEGPEQVDTASAPDFRELERERLVEAWRTHNGRRDAMSAALGLSRSTLYRKLKQHGLT